MIWLKEYKKWAWDSWVAVVMAMYAIVIILVLFYGLASMLCNI